MKTPLRIQKLVLLTLTGVLLAQAALAGPPPRRGGAPAPRSTPKRVCIDIGVSQPIVKTIPASRWPRGVQPNGNIVYLNVTTLVRNHSTTDLNEPVSLNVSFLNQQTRQWQPLAFETISRGIRAGRSQRLNSGFYYDLTNKPEVVAMRAELVGSRRERNDCKEHNDASRAVVVDAKKLATAAANAP